VDEHTTSVLQQYGDGEVIRVKLMKDRNPRHHRLYFALLALVFKNQEKYLSQEALRFAVTIQAGWVDEISLSGDKVALRPKSIAWGKMDQHEFKEYFDAALKAIPDLLPHLDGVDLEDELRKGESA
jgi:hypothetical protein